MYLLDTVTISELRRFTRGGAHANFAAWAKNFAVEDGWLSVVTMQELMTGVLLKRRHDPQQALHLELWVEQTLASFQERILPVDVPVARRCAGLHASRTRPAGDAFIAATALVHNLVVVTRNRRDFEDMGVRLLNPWN